MRRLIAERYPDHAILGEEFGGDRRRDAEHLWLVDPIDGTASFAIGLPLFGTLIGFVRRGEACVGVIGAHALGETVYAAAGQGLLAPAERKRAATRVDLGCGGPGRGVRGLNRARTHGPGPA